MYQSKFEWTFSSPIFQKVTERHWSHNKSAWEESTAVSNSELTDLLTEFVKNSFQGGGHEGAPPFPHTPPHTHEKSQKGNSGQIKPIKLIKMTKSLIFGAFWYMIWYDSEPQPIKKKKKKRGTLTTKRRKTHPMPHSLVGVVCFHLYHQPVIGASPIELWAYGSAVGPVDLHFPRRKIACCDCFSCYQAAWNSLPSTGPWGNSY